MRQLDQSNLFYFLVTLGMLPRYGKQKISYVKKIGDFSNFYNLQLS